MFQRLNRLYNHRYRKLMELRVLLVDRKTFGIFAASGTTKRYLLWTLLCPRSREDASMMSISSKPNTYLLDFLVVEPNRWTQRDQEISEVKETLITIPPTRERTPGLITF